jgi:hypothetical protein
MIYSLRCWAARRKTPDVWPCSAYPLERTYVDEKVVYQAKYR